MSLKWEKGTGRPKRTFFFRYFFRNFFCVLNVVYRSGGRESLARSRSIADEQISSFYSDDWLAQGRNSSMSVTDLRTSTLVSGAWERDFLESLSSPPLNAEIVSISTAGESEVYDGEDTSVRATPVPFTRHGIFSWKKWHSERTAYVMSITRREKNKKFMASWGFCRKPCPFLVSLQLRFYFWNVV